MRSVNWSAQLHSNELANENLGDFRNPSAMNPSIGDIIDGKYRIVSLLGEGGMGAVYEGENLRIHRKVAIKVLHAHVAASPDAVQRFEREAQAAGRIGSEHIVEVLDLGEFPDGDRYMVMEFLEGQALNERILTRGKMTPQNVCRITMQLLEGLDAAHVVGIVHRDLKPDNVFLLSNKRGEADFVKVLDFGISKFNTIGGEFSMTRTGAVMGTPYYLSPEQAKGDRRVDARSDLYAVGVIMWEACAGKVPFDAETFNELLFKIVLEPMPPLTQAVPEVDPEFAAIVEKAMSRDPERRFQSAREMQHALRIWFDQHPASPTAQGSLTTSHALPSGRASPTATASPEQFIEAASAAPRTETMGTPVVAATSTGSNWTTPTVSPHRSTHKLVLSAIAIGVFGVLAGYYVVSSQGATAEQKASARAAQQAAAQTLEHQRAAELAALEAEKATADADQTIAETEQAAAQDAHVASQVARALERPEAPREASPAKQNQTPTPRPSVRQRAMGTGSPASKKESSPARAQTADSPPPPSPALPPRPKGRKIRTEL